MGGQGLADGAGLLGPQVQGDVLLVLQKRTKIVSDNGRDNGSR